MDKKMIEIKIPDNDLLIEDEFKEPGSKKSERMELLKRNRYEINYEEDK